MTCAAKCRRRRRIRRLRTIAPASTAGCWRTASRCGLPKDSYLAFDHPLQQAIRRSVAHFTSTPETDLVAGIDGCSAPNYAVPLSRLALAYARLASVRDDSEFADAPRVLADAMTAHPEMVSGEGRNDLAYMRAGRGDWVTKIGAEGVQAIGIRGAGVGIAIKVVDGAKRGLHPAVVAVLDQLGLLDADQRAALAPWREPTVRNYRGIATGRVTPVVVVDKVAPPVGAMAKRASPRARRELPAASEVCDCKRAPRRGTRCGPGSVVGRVGHGSAGRRRTCRSAGITTNDPGNARQWVIGKSIRSSLRARSEATNGRSSSWS